MPVGLSPIARYCMNAHCMLGRCTDTYAGAQHRYGQPPMASVMTCATSTRYPGAGAAFDPRLAGHFFQVSRTLAIAVSIIPPPLPAPVRPPLMLTFYSFNKLMPLVLLVHVLFLFLFTLASVSLFAALSSPPNRAFVVIHLLSVNVCPSDLAPSFRHVCFY